MKKAFMPRFLAALIGLILLIAAVAKATDMPLFIKSIRAYNIILNEGLLSIAAWGLVGFECAFGVALLVFYQPKKTLLLTAMLMLIFVGVTGWAWLNNTTADCGCFGSWMKRTPGQAALESLFLFAVLVVSWLGIRHSQGPPSRVKACTVAIACVGGLVLPLAFGFSPSHIAEPSNATNAIDFGQLDIQGVDHIDLTKGEYLVVLMDTGCHHCQEAIFQLNTLAHETDLAIIALCTNDEIQRRRFAKEFDLIFPIGQIEEDMFLSLLGDGDIPRTMLVREGQVQQVWGPDIPSPEMIRTG